jgi:glycosyltransferase involved in cell wall biosynthesis
VAASLGDGRLRLELDAEVVAFLGQVPYEEMPAVYRAGDVLVLPSRGRPADGARGVRVGGARGVE